MNRIKGFNEHVDWMKFEPGSPQFAYRFLHMQDAKQAIRTFKSWGYKVTPSTCRRHVLNNGYMFRGLCRNHHYCILPVLSSHGPEYNTLHAIGMWQRYMDKVPDDAMKMLAVSVFYTQSEMPELPTRAYTYPNTPNDMVEVLTALEFRKVEHDDATGRSTYCAKQLFTPVTPKLDLVDYPKSDDVRQGDVGPA